MEPLSKYMEEARTPHKEQIQFSKLSNEGWVNILNEIKKHCPHLIQPEDEEFGNQIVSINYDKNEVTISMPNIWTYTDPANFTIRYKVKGDIVKDWLSQNYKDFTGNDFKATGYPRSFSKLPTDITKPIMWEVPILLALIMNRIPEPLW